MVGLQFGLAGTYIFVMDSLNHGMNRFIFIVYRNAFAAFALAPFALFFERKIRPKMTLSVFLQIMALAFLEPVVDQGISFLGMQYSSAAYASAIMNAVPSVTFVLAAILRVERVKIKEAGSQAKVIGTIVTFGGALFMTLYKGPLIHLFSSHHQQHNINIPTHKHYLAGTILLLLGCLAWSSFYILQSITVKRYPAELSLACFICFMGALQTTVVALLLDHHPRAWALGWDHRLFAPLYTGVVSSGITYYVQGWVMKRRGPVFVTAFSPLCMIIVAVLGSLLLSEHLHLGRKVRPKMTFRIFSEIMLLAFVEIILDQCFTLLGMKLTSASFTSAVMNSVPSITFLLAVILRMERMKIKEMTCQAKVTGTVVTLGGALLMAMYKGPILHLMGSSNTHTAQPQNVSDPTGSQWLMGSFFVLIACSAFAAFYILQAITLKKYQAEMSLATLICLVGSVQSVGVAAYMERHNPHAWALGWDLSVIGGLVVAVGLYLVVWGKYTENKDAKKAVSKDTSQSQSQSLKQQLPVTISNNDEDEPPRLIIVAHNNNNNNSIVDSRLSTTT
ncbi:WAT1-related protein [Senna tora]|uniref:WAT1-related protein n=1 Tax=Senna tora TaxID=362788 RepID=A0A834U3P4_9FABA|nr:WAT1-related protein [Senna tora]